MSNVFDDSNISSSEPSRIIAGDLTRWKKTDDYRNYPPAEYSLKYILRREGESSDKVEIAGSDQTDYYLFSIGSSASTNLRPGFYIWEKQVTRTSDSERVTLNRGTFNVFSNLAEANDDPRNFARRMLAKVQAAIAHRIDNEQLDILAYSLGVETSATRDPAQLREWEKYYKAQIRKLNRATRAKKGQSSLIRSKL